MARGRSRAGIIDRFRKKRGGSVSSSQCLRTVQPKSTKQLLPFSVLMAADITGDSCSCVLGMSFGAGTEQTFAFECLIPS
mmetsp:Transcript_36005/g.78244  ORF Transcript_36005/g.78244 Transcript_36005/m.78244 type:complete len:80 (+) Transcript_36005:138-377(+)